MDGQTFSLFFSRLHTISALICNLKAQMGALMREATCFREGDLSGVSGDYMISKLSRISRHPLEFETHRHDELVTMQTEALAMEGIDIIKTVILAEVKGVCRCILQLVYVGSVKIEVLVMIAQTE